MSKYDILDSEILRSIDTGNRTFSEILQDPVLSAARKTIADKSRTPARSVDARLQALRKKGRIRYARGEWEVA